MRSPRALVVVFAVLAGILPGAARSNTPLALVKAGVGIADATWHVGVGSGQYTAKDPNALNLATGGEIDPHNHSNIQRHSYGVHSRLTYRALVVEGSNGKRVALVKSDSYLAQDLLSRRAAQILAKGASGIGYDQIMLTASHNHSSPYYMSPAWGVWLFQDVFEIRAFEYHARAMAAAIEEAAANLQPARIGATTVRHTIYKGMIAGATVTDDGTPGGYPETYHRSDWSDYNGHGDFNVTVMRVDEAATGKPIGVWVNHGQHPESLDGYDLITADFLGPLERMVQRDTGAPLIFSQGDVGSAEGPRLRYSGGKLSNETLPDGVIRAWAHVGHAQTERGARYLADSIVKAWNEIGAGGGKVPFSTSFPVGYMNGFVPLPVSHPYPSVSNCRTESTAEADPGSPIIGLPNCERAHDADGFKESGLFPPPDKNPATNMLWENLKAHGIALPEHYDAPSFAAVEENLRLHLQAFRIGEVIIASCACEAQVDIILNFESRADNVAGVFNGYDWTRWCAPDIVPDQYKCAHPESRDLANPTSFITFSKARYDRMVAQVDNDAAEWDKVENAYAANTEPANPAEIWGNFTHDELGAENGPGYAIAVGVGHAGDYNGYTVSYREYMSRDHYRKALTCCGPHTADYMSTRMVAMARALRTDDWTLKAEYLDPLAQADEARQRALAEAIGAASGAAFDAWEDSLPNDAGPVAAVTQPAGISRFSAATFTWRGGSNAVDNPIVTVERLNSQTGGYELFADQTGEVQTKVKFPMGAQGTANTYAGNQEWLWTANFEAFDAFPGTVVSGGQTPEGTYKFVVKGKTRTNGATIAYGLESAPFEVKRFEDIKASDVKIDPSGNASFLLRYPRSYTSVFRYIKDDGNTDLCKTCSFRPWASVVPVTGSITVTVVRAGGGTEDAPATLTAGRWVAATALQPGDTATIAAGAIVDDFGETNGAAITLA